MHTLIDGWREVEGTIPGLVSRSFRPDNNKARSVGPGRLFAQPWCLSEGGGRSCAVG